MLPAGDADCDAVAEKVRARGKANFEARTADGVGVGVAKVTVEVEAIFPIADDPVLFVEAADGVFFKPPAGSGGSDLFLLYTSF